MSIITVYYSHCCIIFTSLFYARFKEQEQWHTRHHRHHWWNVVTSRKGYKRVPGVFLSVGSSWCVWSPVWGCACSVTSPSATCTRTSWLQSTKWLYKSRWIWRKSSIMPTSPTRTPALSSPGSSVCTISYIYIYIYMYLFSIIKPLFLSFQM